MADFTYIPDFVVTQTQEFKTLVSKFENGAEQRRGKWAAPIHAFKLQFKNRMQSEMEGIRAFFSNKQGALIPFSWENPIDLIEYTVRFKEDSLTIDLIAYQIYNIALEFVEVK
jgi:phage-related protein